METLSSLPWAPYAAGGSRQWDPGHGWLEQPVVSGEVSEESSSRTSLPTAAFSEVM